MTKRKTKKVEKATLVSDGRYHFCPGCQSRRMMDGTCKKCGYTRTDVSKAEPDKADDKAK